MTVLCDSDVLIDVLRGIPEALTSVGAYESSGPLYVSHISHLELLVGCRNKHEQHLLQQFLDRFLTVPITESTSQRAVALVAQFVLSHNLRPMDALIAATALSGPFALLTKNQRDFRFIPQLHVLPYPALPLVP